MSMIGMVTTVKYNTIMVINTVLLLIGYVLLSENHQRKIKFTVTTTDRRKDTYIYIF